MQVTIKDFVQEILFILLFPIVLTSFPVPALNAYIYIYADTMMLLPPCFIVRTVCSA